MTVLNRVVPRKHLSRAAIGLAVVLGACSAGHNQEVSEYRRQAITPATDLTITRCQPGGKCVFTVGIPKGLGVQGARFVAQSGITLADRVRVINTGNSPGTIANNGSPEVNIGADARTGDVWSLPRVVLRDRAQVQGTVRSPAGVVLGSGASVTGQVIRDAELLPLEIRSWFVSPPKTFQNGFTLLPDKTANLAPGAYNTITVHSRSTLTLSSGTYYVKTVAIEPQATLRLNQANGPVFIYVQDSITHRGSITTTTNALPNLLIGYSGTTPFHVEGHLHATVVAPNAQVSLRSTAPAQYSGSFFAKQLDAQPGVVITLYPSLLPTVGGTDRQDCASKIQPNPALPEPLRTIQAQLDLLTTCAAPGIPDCAAKMTAVANADRRAAAQQYLAKTIGTSQHLAIVRDRTRKLHRARKNPTIEAAYCNGRDPDGDLIPEPQDQCPNTPPLTPTNDVGCPNGNAPPAPPRVLVDAILDRMGVLYDKPCEGAPAPTTPLPVLMCGLSDAKALVVSRVTNQPAGCAVYYEIQIATDQLNPAEPRSFYLAYSTAEELLPSPDIAGAEQGPFFRQRVTAGTDRGRWARADNSNGLTVTMSARATNGNGLQSSWSGPTTFNVAPCLGTPPTQP